MGKRSSFPRITRDFYATPLAATIPLLPYLKSDGIVTFAEPCAGDGDLIRHLEAAGFVCSYRGDLATGQDGRRLTRAHCGNADCIITNPPFAKPLMHELLEQFIDTGLPVWILSGLDWVANLSAIPYLPRCSDVIPIGRVKWFPDSEHTSLENYAWFRFYFSHAGVTAIRNTRERRTPNALELRQGTR
jgi:hypothetical protein